ncbi:steroidogenic factor 1 isoform X2 [Lingula anatina]|uniref:Steroidogenic factor 1 isoform X2 n=1 Tax=Lingula anatina TaxID=7574 RepID=A0A1S3HRX5_LINAN|nr:steroidogenic factor 1 isoform X2 [Lingula anatina]|eukprot:XP_013388792.1 steroidogenic factor 1 isoform X2 [Lingula anatina]
MFCCQDPGRNPFDETGYIKRERSSCRYAPFGSDRATSVSMDDFNFNHDVKGPIAELCPVCGDKVSGYHYGLLTCESCKGFFKRTVQNKKVYSCVDDQSCHIDKSQRKRCPYCRFQKCLLVGMKLEAVREDRMRGGRNKFGPMYKRDRAMKQQQVRQRSGSLNSCQLAINDSLALYDQDQSRDQVSPIMLNMNGGQVGPKGEMDSTGIFMADSSKGMASFPSSQYSPGLLSHPVAHSHVEMAPQVQVPHLNQQSQPPPQQQQQQRQHQHQQQQQQQRQQQQQQQQRQPQQQQYLPQLPQLMKDLQKIEAERDRTKENKVINFLLDQIPKVASGDVQPLLMILCKLADQMLFLLVDWARAALFFKDLKVEDQMKLLQNSWSELLIMDFLFKQMKNKSWPSDIVLPTGQLLRAEYMNSLDVVDIKNRLSDLVKKFQELKLDHNEYLCLKYLLLLNPDVNGVLEQRYVEQCQERINATLLEYSMLFNPDFKDKFGQLLLRMSEIRLLSIRVEEYLYYRHLHGDVPEQTLLMEMLHAKRK